jgi:uncharacterized protein
MTVEGLEFNVSQLLRQNIGDTVDEDVDVAQPLDLEDIATRRIRGHVHLIRTNFGILAHVDLRAVVDLECDRCLEIYSATVGAHFSEEYLPVIDVSTGRPVQSERTDETFFISPNHIVDVTEAARQHLLLAIPMHHVCKEECRGLCAICGSNRNMNPCQCVTEADHPLSAIAALLRDASSPS